MSLDNWIEMDLSAAAEAGDLRPAYEVEHTLRQINDATEAGMCPVLVGPSGVGKTAIVHELARRLADGDGPPRLRGRRIVQISIKRQVSGQPTQRAKSKLPKLIQELIKDLCAATTAHDTSANTVVPFLRDFDMVWKYDLEAQALELARRLNVPVIGEASPIFLDNMFAHESELEEHYVRINVAEPDIPKTQTILKRWTAVEQERTGQECTDEGLEEALFLTERFLPSDARPRKTLDAIRQAYVWTDRDHPVRATDVDACFAERHELPRFLIDPTIPLDLAEVRKNFLTRVLGQAEAVESGVRMVSLMKSRLADERRPLGVFLYVGPTGVGKTYLARVVSEYIFGNVERMIRFNMADYQHENGVYELFGHNQGTGETGAMEQRLFGCSFGVVLFDEFEKAHPAVIDRFMQLMDEGCFVNAQGRTISCRSLVLIATSNAGSEIYRRKPPGFTNMLDNKALEVELDRRLENHFRFELLNRFDQVVHFHPLSREAIRTIARRELDLVQQRIGLRQRAWTIELDEAVLDWLAVHGYDPDFGARFLQRTIERNVTTSLAEFVVENDLAPGSRITLTVRANRICVRAPESKTPVERLPVNVSARPADETRIRHLKPKELLQEIDRFIKRAKQRLTGLSDKRQRRSRLLAAMNEAGFWDHTLKNRERLEAYRELDVAIQIEGRLARPIMKLCRLREHSEDSSRNHPQHHQELAQCFEEAQRALQEWDQRDLEERPASVWMVISNADPLRSAGTWIEELVKIETAWSKRLMLDAEVVAYEVIDEHVSRAALQIEGTGAATYLAMEEGLHRLNRRDHKDLRAAVRVIDQSNSTAGAAVEIERTRRRMGRFQLRVGFRGKLEVADRGVSMEWLGDNEDTLSHLLADLEHEFATRSVDELDVVRLYADQGVGARDLRTGVVIPRMKDVREGKLHKLLDAWREPVES